MSKAKTRTERFDEAFKMLLIVITVIFAFSRTFFEETMELKFFSYSVGVLFFVIVVWTFSTLYGGKPEYFGKIVAWYFLMLTFGITVSRLYFTVFILPPLAVSVITIVCLGLTLPALEYLKNTFNEDEYKFLRKAFSFMTLVFIILDVLYFLGVITFPLFQ